MTPFRRRAVIAACAALALAAMHARGEVRLYDATELAMSGYELVARLPVDSWRTAIGMPPSRTTEEGIAALQRAAGTMNADGLMNAYCVRATAKTGFHCYADAVRVKAKR